MSSSVTRSLFNPRLILSSSSTAGTFESIPVSAFGTHVKRMHANDDYLFSEEYNVSEEPKPVVARNRT